MLSKTRLILHVLLTYELKIIMVLYPNGSAGKESVCNSGNTENLNFVPGSGTTPGEGNGVGCLTRIVYMRVMEGSTERM